MRKPAKKSKPVKANKRRIFFSLCRSPLWSITISLPVNHVHKGGKDMLTIFDRDRRHSRRAFLQVGSLALGSLALTDLLAAKAKSADLTRPLVKDRSVIFLFLHGGPSQTETFDPKMSAPVEFRSATGEIRTRLPGVTFGGTFPRLAALADKLTVVRSFVTGDG